jgi:hypothetical protein
VGKPFEPEELFQKIASFTLPDSSSVSETYEGREPVKLLSEIQPNAPSINIEKFVTNTGNSQELQRLITLTTSIYRL